MATWTVLEDAGDKFDIESFFSTNAVMAQSSGFDIAVFGDTSQPYDVIHGIKESGQMNGPWHRLEFQHVDGLSRLTLAAMTDVEIFYNDFNMLTTFKVGAEMAAALFTGNDTLIGSSHDDILRGYAGKDNLDGGTGVDDLYGGAGKDVFEFSTGDSGKTKAKADTIFDFDKNDFIDLTGWDANSKKNGVQDFRFVGGEDFHGKVGELHVIKGKSDTWVEADTNGNRKPDFIIHLDDAFALKAGDFHL